MTPEPVDLGGECPDHIQQGVDHPTVSLGNGLQVDERVLREAVFGDDFCHFAREHVQSLRNTVEDTLARLRHAADANRLGSDGQGSLSGEPTGEFREDRQVGVQPDPIQPTDAEREK